MVNYDDINKNDIVYKASSNKNYTLIICSRVYYKSSSISYHLQGINIYSNIHNTKDKSIIYNYVYSEGAIENIMSETKEFNNVYTTYKQAMNVMNNNESSVEHPKHYNLHPSGIECITIARHYCFSIGNAIKYLWRAGLKKEQGLDDKTKEIEDLEKAIWYIKDRIEELKSNK